MPDSDSNDTTRLLNGFSNGDVDAAARMTSIVFEELHQIAERLMRGERPDHTLQPTALINEIYLRLFDKKIEYHDRAHFIALASRLMRRLLVDNSRRRRAVRRQSDRIKIPLDAILDLPQDSRRDLVALSDALNDFEPLRPRASQIVEMRFFGGFQLEEIAEALGISVATVKREWDFAQVWLYDQLKGNGA